VTSLLLHVCCAPCAIYPVRVLRAAGNDLRGFFYRDNIHPYRECLRREETLAAWAGEIDLPVIHAPGYDLEGFLQRMVFRETERCRICYHTRLQAAARIARHGRFDTFSTTLLYSRRQQHDLIRAIGEAVAVEEGIPFYYEDFRSGWAEGIEASKARGMYRQTYCGCIYSEKARYFTPLKASGKADRVR
jgi:predicted adenine nucleotide alpha hydrolase (AANH) superfamily ATPase